MKETEQTLLKSGVLFLLRSRSYYDSERALLDGASLIRDKRGVAKSYVGVRKTQYGWSSTVQRRQ